MLWPLFVLFYAPVLVLLPVLMPLALLSMVVFLVSPMLFVLDPLLILPLAFLWPFILPMAAVLLPGFLYFFCASSIVKWLGGSREARDLGGSLFIPSLLLSTVLQFTIPWYKEFFFFFPIDDVSKLLISLLISQGGVLCFWACFLRLWTQ
jgi:hypothetical protein